MPSDIPAEKFPPSKLGEYKVVDEIAEGTFGKVKSTCNVSGTARTHPK